MHYLVLKALHVIGVVLFLGNILTGIFWKAHGDRGDLRARAQAIEGIIRCSVVDTRPSAASWNRAC
jgi:uncharacterized membrane protein